MMIDLINLDEKKSEKGSPNDQLSALECKQTSFDATIFFGDL